MVASPSRRRATSPSVALAAVRHVVSDKDVWQSAQALIKQHGEDAHIHAAMKADELLEKGDVEGQAIWKRVIAAVNELQRDKAADGETTH